MNEAGNAARAVLGCNQLAAYTNEGMKPEMQLGLYLAAFANAGMKPEMQFGLYLVAFGCVWLHLQMKE